MDFSRFIIRPSEPAPHLAYKTCFHTHTSFCDGKGSVEEFCEAAYENGFAALGFSAHAPLTTDIGADLSWLLPENRFDDYCEAVNKAKREWRGRLDVFLGLEADYIEGIASPARWRDRGLDYIIGSTHFVRGPRGGGWFGVDANPARFEKTLRDEFSGDSMALVRAYYGNVKKMAREGGFDILGHFDLVKKNNAGNRFFDIDGREYREIASDAARVVAEAQKTRGFLVEINCGAIARQTYPDVYPSAFLREQLRGVPFIVTGDAHETGHLGVGYDLIRRQGTVDKGQIFYH